MTTLVVADVHGAFSALARLVTSGDRIVILGDLINLIDYRSNVGIIPDVVGANLVKEIVALRDRDRAEEANELWQERTADLGIDVRGEIGTRMEVEYRQMRSALEGGSVIITHGNVDDPALLRAALPDGCSYLDGSVIDIDGERFGVVGGGVPRIGSRGEVRDDDMRRKLDAMGPVDVLCSHVPPAIPMLAEDVVGGPAKGSVPLRDYVDEHRPRLHYFGDIHQPRASRLVHGHTLCVNVGYFRATGRAHIHMPPG
jgi:Icc-related predicted phosphoesterase